MGIRFGFFCDCGYRTFVSGMPDRGFIAEFLTVECTDCKVITDIITRYTDKRADEGKVGKCRKCGGQNLVPWGEIKGYEEYDEDRYNCPKCDGLMIRDENNVMMFD